MLLMLAESNLTYFFTLSLQKANLKQLAKEKQEKRRKTVVMGGVSFSFYLATCGLKRSSVMMGGESVPWKPR